MKVLGVVTARGGSKGIHRKNLTMLAGKPLIAYTVAVALASQRLTRVILSTDDEEIANVGKKLGLDIPFIRPDFLAQDETRTIHVLQHVIRELEKVGEKYDAVFTLQPTNPLRLTSDIDGSITLLEKTGADSVISFTEVGEKHPARMKFIDSDGRVHNPSFAEDVEGQPRQTLPKLYLREGSVYLTRRSVLMVKESIAGNDCRAWIIPAERACNIDTPFDIFIAEQILKCYHKKVK